MAKHFRAEIDGGAREIDFRGVASAYERDGYAIVREALPRPLVDEAGAFLAAEVEDAVATLRRELGLASNADPVAAIDAAVAGGGDSLAAEVRKIAIGHFPLAVRLSERMWPIGRALKPLAAALLRAERVAMHVPPAARFVLPGNMRAGVPPHQDFRYNEHLPTPFLTIWVPFVDIDESCGGVVIYEGADRDALGVPRADGPWLGGVATDRFEPRRLELARGDVLVLDDHKLHGSAPNSSSRIRISADYRFFDGARRSRKHALDLDSMVVTPPAESA